MRNIIYLNFALWDVIHIQNKTFHSIYITNITRTHKQFLWYNKLKMEICWIVEKKNELNICFDTVLLMLLNILFNKLLFHSAHKYIHLFSVKLISLNHFHGEPHIAHIYTLALRLHIPTSAQYYYYYSMKFIWFWCEISIAIVESNPTEIKQHMLLVKLLCKSIFFVLFCLKSGNLEKKLYVVVVAIVRIEPHLFAFIK